MVVGSAVRVLIICSCVNLPATALLRPKNNRAVSVSPFNMVWPVALNIAGSFIPSVIPNPAASKLPIITGFLTPCLKILKASLSSLLKVIVSLISFEGLDLNINGGLVIFTLLIAAPFKNVCSTFEAVKVTGVFPVVVTKTSL